MTTAIWIAVALWFATGWYLNLQLKEVHEKLDRLFDQFSGLREYLYEIDPQFADERAALCELHDSCAEEKPSFAGIGAIEMLRQKNKSGSRTLSTGFGSDQNS